MLWIFAILSVLADADFVVSNEISLWRVTNPLESLSSSAGWTVGVKTIVVPNVSIEYELPLGIRLPFITWSSDKVNP